MLKKQHITGIILAGGKSSRMGTNKALLMLGNKTFVECSIELLKPFCHSILISANHSEFVDYGYEVVPDLHPGIGPLAGLEACLIKSHTVGNLVLPCDVPMLNTVIFQYILENADNNDAVIPVWNDGNMEPLIGYFSKRIAPVITNQIAQGEYGVKRLLKHIRTKYVPLPKNVEIRNINTPTDYQTLIQQEKNLSPSLLLMPTLILVSGTGRKVGKTLFACEVIAHLSKNVPVVAIKISNHFHPVDASQKWIAQNSHYQIIEEQYRTDKDSGRMKKSGAIKSYYIQAEDDTYIFEAFLLLRERLDPNQVIVCESNSMTKYVKPALHFLVGRENILTTDKLRPHVPAYNVSFAGSVCSFDVTQITFDPYLRCVKLKEQSYEQI